MPLLHSFAVLGGDARQRYLALQLRRSGRRVFPFAVPGLPDSFDSLEKTLSNVQAVCLSLPAVQNGCIAGLPSCSPARLTSLLPPGAALFGGGLGALKPVLPEKIPACDYLQIPSLVLANAALTAEGALCLVMQALPSSIKDSHILVTGFGRIGKSLAMKLRLLGAHVTLSTRSRENYPAIYALGCEPDETAAYQCKLSLFDCVCNTVPAPIFSESQLAMLSPECVYLELASPPGGIAQGAEKPPLFIPAPGLPGRFAPKTAAQILFRAICSYNA